MHGTALDLVGGGVDPYNRDFCVDRNRFHETVRLIEETHCTA